MTRADSAELRVTFRVCLSDSPPRLFLGYRDIVGGVQCKTDVLPGKIGSDGHPYFSGELRARRDAASGIPVFLGTFAFGPPTARFLYLSWSAVAVGAVDDARAMFPRLKVPLPASRGLRSSRQHRGRTFSRRGFRERRAMAALPALPWRRQMVGVSFHVMPRER